MKENCLFTPDQSGFLRLYSTLTCLFKMSDDWYNGLDLGKLVRLAFIDLKKAFDTVDHDILCKKLEHYSVQKRELSCITSYISNRKQFCRVNQARIQTTAKYARAEVRFYICDVMIIPAYITMLLAV